MENVKEKEIIGRKKKVINGFTKRGIVFCYAMLSFSIVHFFVFWIMVNANSLKIAFTVRDGIGVEKFSLANFELFFVDIVNPNGTIMQCAKNTVLYFIADMFKRGVAFLVAYFFYKKIWGAKTFRVIFFLPSIISDIIEVTIFKSFIATYGPMYNLLLSVLDMNFLRF